MKKTTVKDLLSTPELMGTEVEAKGWVRTRRGNKHVRSEEHTSELQSQR